MFNYYINAELIEEYPLKRPREFRFGETHRIKVIDGQEDATTKEDNTLTDLDDAILYYKDKDENEYNRCIGMKDGSDDYKIYRESEYGSVETQLEYIVENGVDKFIDRQNAIKAKHKKPS